MKQSLRNKLTSRRGETLTETLAGILIVGLASAVLAGMIAASARINAAAVAADAALYAAVTKAEKGDRIGGETVNVEVTVAGTPHEFPSALCGDGELPLCSYRFQKGAAP